MGDVRSTGMVVYNCYIDRHHFAHYCAPLGAPIWVHRGGENVTFSSPTNTTFPALPGIPTPLYTPPHKILPLVAALPPVPPDNAAAAAARHGNPDPNPASYSNQMRTS